MQWGKINFCTYLKSPQKNTLKANAYTQGQKFYSELCYVCLSIISCEERYLNIVLFQSIL